MLRLVGVDATYRGQARAWTRSLLACGVVGPALFVAAFLVDGASRSSYSQLRDYVSELSFGTGGWIQTANFIICGWLVLAFAAGLSRVSGNDVGSASAPALISMLGLGLIGAGTFGTDPIGSPATLHGDLHFLATIAIAVALSATCLILVPAIDNVSSSTWRRISVLTGFVVPALFLLSNVAPPFLLPGLVERAALILGAGWVATFASRVLRRM